MCGTDADADDIQVVIPGKDACTATNATPHVENLRTCWELIEPAPAHEFVDERCFRFAEIVMAWWIPVVAEMHVVTPKTFKQPVIGPGVVSSSDTFR